MLRSFNPAFEKLLTLPTSVSAARWISSPEKCQQIIDKLDLPSKYSPGNLDIIEAFSPTFLFSSMVNRELRPRRHVVMVSARQAVNRWTSAIDHLRQTTGNVENYSLYPHDPYQWSSYTSLLQEMAPPKQDMSKIHDELLFVANVSSPSWGESLMAQWMMCCAHRNWIQRYGRVRMVMTVPEQTAQKFMAGAGFGKRNKSAVKCEMFTKTRLLAITTPTMDIGFREYPGFGYDPRVVVRDQPVLLTGDEIRPQNSSFAMVEFEPRAVECPEDFELYEYIMQQLFINKDRPIGEMLSRVALGAEDLASEIPAEILAKGANRLSVEEWDTLWTAFSNWPFKPSVLDTYDMSIDERRV
ncbi:mitochondrial transcription factor 1 [Diutina catenulata]